MSVDAPLPLSKKDTKKIRGYICQIPPVRETDVQIYYGSLHIVHIINKPKDIRIYRQYIHRSV